MSLTTPLRRRDFRLLWTGMSVSLLGDGIFIVAIAWQAYAVSNHPSSLAYVGLATSLPQIFLLLFGGAVSDRMNRQSVLFLADLVRGMVVGSLAVVTAFGNTQLWELYVFAGLIGIATAFASPAFDAMVPQLVPKDELTQANAVDQVVRPVSLQLAGPALGGLAVATVHLAGAFVVDALTFLFSASCILRMSPVAATGAAGPRQQLRRGHSRRAALRASPSVAVGNVPLGDLHIPALHRTDSGAPAVHRAEYPPRGSVDLRHRPGGRRGGCPVRRGPHGSGPRAEATGDVDLHVVDGRHPRRRGLRARHERHGACSWPRSWSTGPRRWAPSSGPPSSSGVCPIRCLGECRASTGASPARFCP